MRACACGGQISISISISARARHAGPANDGFGLTREDPTSGGVMWWGPRGVLRTPRSLTTVSRTVVDADVVEHVRNHRRGQPVQTNLQVRRRLWHVVAIFDDVALRARCRWALCNVDGVALPIRIASALL